MKESAARGGARNSRRYPGVSRNTRSQTLYQSATSPSLFWLQILEYLCLTQKLAKVVWQERTAKYLKWGMVKGILRAQKLYFLKHHVRGVFPSNKCRVWGAITVSTLSRCLTPLWTCASQGGNWADHILSHACTDPLWTTLLVFRTTSHIIFPTIFDYKNLYGYQIKLKAIIIFSAHITHTRSNNKPI